MRPASPVPGQNRTLTSDAQNRILLEKYFLPGALEQQIEAFVEHYNHRRYHESIGNLTPVDVYVRPGDIVALERERIKPEIIR